MSSDLADENMSQRVYLNAPHMNGNEWNYVKECLDTNWISSSGSFVDRFESNITKVLGVKHAVATVNGTAALHVALLVAGVKPDEEVLVPTLTFIASVNPIRYIGAWPIFMDAEPRYWQIDPDKLIDFLENKCQWKNGHLVNQITDRRVRAILPVHILGHPCDMDPIMEIAKKYDLRVIEDATESLGAKYKDLNVGHLGDIACFSFNGNKTITTGGGGMIVTDNNQWAQRARHLTTQAKIDPFEYIHDEIGYNYRLTNVQAAIGVAQLEQLDSFIQNKRITTDFYNERLQNIEGFLLPQEASWAQSSCWLYMMLVDRSKSEIDSRRLMRHLDKSNVESRPFWCPAHMQGYYNDCQQHRIEVAPRLYKQGVSLPSSAGVTDIQRKHVSERILELISYV